MVMKNCNAGKENFSHYRYPFIRSASSFSGSSSFSSSSGGSNAYDYIIVGGGTAGCPLAATLSQNFSVLLLERGGVPFSNANISFLKNFHIALADISPTSASQFFVSTDGVINTRARVLGGGTCINAGFYTRASTRYICFSTHIDMPHNVRRVSSFNELSINILISGPENMKNTAIK
jgi:fatty acid omega-hydroxy dehydrogenase